MVWTTKDELQFLEGLGTFAKNAPKDAREKYFRRRKLLDGYRRSMALRKCWNGIEREKIAEYLEKHE